jgi:hypothetical protein
MDAKASLKKKKTPIDKFQFSFFIGYLKWILRFIYIFSSREVFRSFLRLFMAKKGRLWAMAVRE